MTLFADNSDLPSTSDAPVQSAELIDVSGEDMVGLWRALWIGGAGSLRVTLVKDTDPVTFAAVPAGTLLPFAVKTVHSDETDATDIVGLK